MTKRSFLMVACLFCAVAITLNLCVAYGSAHLTFVNLLTASAITKLMHLSGLQARMDGDIIYLTNSIWRMAVECNAVSVVAIFSSFIIVYPAPVIDRGAAIVGGAAFIFLANITRLYMMAWIDKLKPEFSEYFHNYVWQVAFIVMVVFMWMLWIDWVTQREAKNSVPR